jgi:2-polyprenyl-3-methyl-5-hydroxy-6-metoxy-1,4-benzoquinol methylase
MLAPMTESELGEESSTGVGMASDDELETQERFRQWYGLESEVLGEIERAVIDADYGANGYTTRAQVDEIVRRLDIGAADRVLDVGTGRGWPATYLARTTGCSVVASDLPFEGLVAGKRRAEHDALGRRVFFVAARGEQLPLREESFDVVVHTDVLC